MNKQDIERMARAWQEVTEAEKIKEMHCKKCGEMHKKDAECDMDDDMDEAMDPVNKKELKGKHADRTDKDIDNDGDVDSSDKYLHKRRKAISKNVKKAKGETATMNPKLDTAKDSSKGSEMEQKESRIRTALKSVLAEKAAHSPNKDKAEDPDDAFKGAGAKQMKADLTEKEKEKITDYDKLGHDDAAAAGRAGPSTKMRSNDNKQGDKKVVNPVAGVVTKEK